MSIDIESLNQINATAQKADLSKQLENSMEYIRFDVSQDATGGLNVMVPYNIEVIDVIVHGTSTNASGTLTLSRNGTDITDAIDCATDGAVDRAATLDKAEVQILSTDTLTITANGSGDRGTMYIIGIRF